jgi:hypothetical protein
LVHAFLQTAFRVYAFFTAGRPSSSPFLRATEQTPVIHLIQEFFMDIAYVTIAAGLWGLMALLVRGFQLLEKPPGGRP